MTHRRTAAAAAGLVAFVLVGGVAHASGATVLGAGATLVAPCTEAGLQADLDLEGVTVRSVTVAGLPDACRGDSLLVTVGRRTGPDVETSGPVTGASVVLPVPAGVSASDVEQLAVAVVG